VLLPNPYPELPTGGAIPRIAVAELLLPQNPAGGQPLLFSRDVDRALAAPSSTDRVRDGGGGGGGGGGVVRRVES
jgi:hypothetical protein